MSLSKDEELDVLLVVPQGEVFDVSQSQIKLIVPSCATVTTLSACISDLLSKFLDSCFILTEVCCQNAVNELLLGNWLISRSQIQRKIVFVLVSVVSTILATTLQYLSRLAATAHVAVSHSVCLVVACVPCLTSVPVALVRVVSILSHSISSVGASAWFLEKVEQSFIALKDFPQFDQDLVALWLIHLDGTFVVEPPDDERTVGSTCHVNCLVLVLTHCVSLMRIKSRCLLVLSFRLLISLVLQAYLRRLFQIALFWACFWMFHKLLVGVITPYVELASSSIMVLPTDGATMGKAACHGFCLEVHFYFYSFVNE